MKRFPQELLERFAESTKGLLHPEVCARAFQDIGAGLARAVVNHAAHAPSQTPTAHDYVRYGDWMRSEWGWEQTMSVAKGRTIEVQCPTCPFDKLAKHDSLVCQAEAALLGELAGHLFGYGKVVIERGQGDPPRDCRLTVHTERTPHTLAIDGLTVLSKRHGERRTADHAAASHEWARLTPRERQIMALLAEGFSDKHIAQTLTLSVRTVEGHLARIREKIGLRSRGALIRFALRTMAP